MPTLQGGTEQQGGGKKRLLERSINCPVLYWWDNPRQKLVYSQGVDLVRYSPRDVWGADADDGLLGTGASWRTFENPFRFSRSRNKQKRDPGQKPLLCMCHVASWTLIIVNETEVGAGSSFKPPRRHPNAAVQRKALTQADTAAAASRKAASVSDRGGKKKTKKNIDWSIITVVRGRL